MSVKAVLLLAGLATAQGVTAQAPETVQTVIARAIKAQGGLNVLLRYRASQSKTKGTFHGSTPLTFSHEAAFQLPAQLRELQEITVDGKKVRTTFLLNGDKGWINRDGKTTELPPRLLEELREAANLGRIVRLVPLLDASEYRLSLAPEGTVPGRRLIGVQVSSKGFRDVLIYFSKDTGLLSKIERRTVDGTGREIVEERILADYQPVQGVLTARKIAVRRGGERFMDAEVIEIRYFEKLDDSMFSHF